MKLTFQCLISCVWNIPGVLAQGVENDHIIIDYSTGFVDGFPLPGDLANNVFRNEIGRTIASILELNVTAMTLDKTTLISLDDTSNPCHKW